jgi:hypothetical protein
MRLGVEVATVPTLNADQYRQGDSAFEKHGSRQSGSVS